MAGFAVWCLVLPSFSVGSPTRRRVAPAVSAGAAALSQRRRLSPASSASDVRRRASSNEELSSLIRLRPIASCVHKTEKRASTTTTTTTATTATSAGPRQKETRRFERNGAGVGGGGAP